MRNTQNQQAGFTLIELVMVIVILGVLAATALPRFVNLKGDAETSALAGTAGALASAASINYAACSANNNVALAGKCVLVAKCSDAGALLLPTITIGTTASTTVPYLVGDVAVATNGLTGSCVLKKDLVTGGATFATATYTVIGAAN